MFRVCRKKMEAVVLPTFRKKKKKNAALGPSIVKFSHMLTTVICSRYECCGGILPITFTM